MTAIPPWLSHLNDKHLPNRALVILTGVLIGSMFPFAFLARNLISAGTLVSYVTDLISNVSFEKA